MRWFLIEENPVGGLPALLGGYAVLDGVVGGCFAEHSGHLVALAVVALSHVAAAGGLANYGVLHGHVLLLSLHAVGLDHF